MGMEISEGCTDKEPDGVIIYSDVSSPVSSYETDPIHGDDKEAPQDPKVIPLPEESDVKECTSEKSFKISEARQDENVEDQNYPRIKVANDRLPEKTNPPSIKAKGETKGKVSPKLAAKITGTNGRANCTVPQPFSLATEKRATVRPVESETDVVKSLVRSKTVQPPNGVKKHQQIVTKKPQLIENKKHSDEDDSNSAASDIAPSAQVSKSKIVALAPSFKSTARAEKRREYYSKLEEKHQALEAEKLQSEARTKEEVDATIKQMRRNMMFKASPMPSFYHDGPPPKLELKKVPPTRAKSPKLGRRKSCSDATGLPTKTLSRPNRHSLGTLKEDPNISDTTSGTSVNTLTCTTYEDDEELNHGQESINGAQVSALNRQNNTETLVMS